MVLALVGSGEVGVMWLVKSRLRWTNLVKWEVTVKWERATVVEVVLGNVVKCCQWVVKCGQWVLNWLVKWRQSTP